MDNLIISATKDSPDISFDSDKNILEIRGKSYPENALEFFTPVFNWINEYLEKDHNEKITVNIGLYYFNSSSSKILLDLCDIFEEACENGKNIILNWIYEEGDEDSLEFAEILSEDLDALEFKLVEIPPPY